MMMTTLIRSATLEDQSAIQQLYLTVAKTPGGIARELNEITSDYIGKFLSNALKSGLILVCENSESPQELIAEIHSYTLEPNVFSHVLSELTIVVHPKFQGQGVGRLIFESFLKKIQTFFPHISRVELIARESNKKAIKFYETLGFKQEGRLEKRIKNTVGNFEADIPMAWIRI
jgi:ribosomal protein S18 acetylase RimI-like enzyme